MIDVREYETWRIRTRCFEDPDSEDVASLVNAYIDDLARLGGQIIGISEPVVSGVDGVGDENTITYVISIVYARPERSHD